MMKSAADWKTEQAERERESRRTERVPLNFLETDIWNLKYIIIREGFSQLLFQCKYFESKIGCFEILDTLSLSQKTLIETYSLSLLESAKSLSILKSLENYYWLI